MDITFYLSFQLKNDTYNSLPELGKEGRGG